MVQLKTGETLNLQMNQILAMNAFVERDISLSKRQFLTLVTRQNCVYLG